MESRIRARNRNSKRGNLLSKNKVNQSQFEDQPKKKTNKNVDFLALRASRLMADAKTTPNR